MCARIEPKQFEECFLNWVAGVTEKITGVVAIDGKTLRRSHDGANGKKALHVVSAWATEHRMVLAQVAVDEKSNAHDRHPGGITSLGRAKAVW